MTTTNKILLGITILFATISITSMLSTKSKVPIEKYNDVRDSLIVQKMAVDSLNIRFKRLSDTLGVTLHELDKSRLEAKLKRIELIREASKYRSILEDNYVPISDAELLSRIIYVRDSLILAGEDVKYKNR